jgi:Mis12 protein
MDLCTKSSFVRWQTQRGYQRDMFDVPSSLRVFLIHHRSRHMSVQATAPSVLLPELLGFSPQFVLDQIINIANNAVQQSVDAIEGFLRRWADKRVEKLGGDWDSTQEIEQGLVAFQTLLESHVDIALDFFEVWCMRNIFVVPADLPIVVPHQRGLNLEQPPEKEQELLAEIEDLRRQIEVVSGKLAFYDVQTHDGDLATETE